MSNGKSDKIRYKPYEQNQAYLIPPSAEKLIPENHLVRLVNEVITVCSCGYQEDKSLISEP
jgi:transposase